MSISFTTDPIDRHAREGEIVEAIELAYQGDGKKGSPAKGQADAETATEAAFVVGAAKRLATNMISVLGPNIATYTITVQGHVNPGNARKKGWAKDGYGVLVNVVDYVEPAKADESDDEDS